ncbi:putative adipose-regulatory protein-domain-containing protein [Boletus edulis BED1]|uniref:Adipose-regulatory protein-domain-containing protein n=1 Tax=Boletus edulis BED1 TaxID=1328754 RepID=A0AAD4C1G8_BOLED|nr:putative adipose-regulatory protein-domain-containing protein [Boletus edulis BED1]
MVRPLPKLEPDDDAVARPSYNPFSILRTCAIYLFPPPTSLRIASRLVPLLVCLSLIPLVLFFSLFSGWYIWKNIPVAWQVPIYLQYGDSPLPYAELSLPPLSTAQPYDISLQMVLPASEANLALGNFMATLSLSTPSNKTLVTVSRPAIALPPKRATFSLSAVPRLIDLDVPLLSSYVPETSRMNARIDIGRRDGWKSLGNGEGRELSVWNAALRGAVRRHGIRGLVSRFPLTFALVASAAFFSLSVIVLAACILPAIQSPVSVDQTPNVSEPKEDRHVRVRKRSRRNVAGESRVTNTVRSNHIRFMILSHYICRPSNPRIFL